MTSTTQYRQIMMIGIGESPSRWFTLHGLNKEELKAVSDALGHSIHNEVNVWDSSIEAMNALGKLGYHVVTTTYVKDLNIKKIIWMLVKTI